MRVLNMAGYVVTVLNVFLDQIKVAAIVTTLKQTWVGPRETICYVAKPVSKIKKNLFF